MRKIISSVAIGISWGFTILVLIMAVGVSVNPDFLANIEPHTFVAKYVVCSAITGLGFSVPSLIYENERLSRGLQVLFHLGIGFVVYIPTAFYAGWIPTEFGFVAVAVSLMISVVFALLVWFCFSLYFKKQAKIMNEKIVEKQNSKVI